VAENTTVRFREKVALLAVGDIAFVWNDKNDIYARVLPSKSATKTPAERQVEYG